jgi:hypothetical protein
MRVQTIDELAALMELMRTNGCLYLETEDTKLQLQPQIPGMPRDFAPPPHPSQGSPLGPEDFIGERGDTNPFEDECFKQVLGYEPPPPGGRK